MNRSESINELAGALAKAQGLVEGASKDKVNPAFHSRYADLSSVWDACRGPLSANGLAVVQAPRADGQRVTVTTTVFHSSGQWLSEELTVNAKDALPQSVGSAITYARRYALMSFVGIAPDDDDGNETQGKPTAPRPAPKKVEPSKPAQSGAGPAPVTETKPAPTPVTREPGDDAEELGAKPTELDRMLAAIGECSTEGILQTLTEPLSQLPDADKTRAREAFGRRRDELRKGAA